jgi:hypothetical protein
VPTKALRSWLLLRLLQLLLLLVLSQRRLLLLLPRLAGLRLRLLA